MKHSAWLTATALAAALTLPLSAGAQDKKDQAPPAAAAPHPAPAPHVAPPAPHVAAPPPHVAPPAPHPVVRAAPPPPAVHAAPPHPVVRAAPPHPAVQAPHPAARVAPPHNAVQHAATPRVTPRAVEHAAAPSNAVQAAKPASTAAKSAQPNAALSAQTNAQTLSPAAQRRADRAERRHEQQVLRSLPPSKRAAQREEFRRQREQRLNAQTSAPAQNAAAQSNAATKVNALAQSRNARRNGGTAITAQTARQGRFASRFASRANTANAAASADPAPTRRAWHHHHRAAFVAWYGPVFWPYAYSDIFDYTFWPDGYDEGYWDYAYDDFFDGVFWGESGPPAAYASAAPATAQPRVTYAGAQELCNEPGTGITAWPFTDIARKVGLNAQQKDLLNDMRAAAKKAAAVFKDSCPAQGAFALTPPGRLAAMTARLGATLEAVRIVKPALSNFYNSLNDEQKERFNEIGPSPQVVQAAKSAAETTGSTGQEEQSCKQPKPGLANLPIDKIEDVVQPTDAQETGLDQLQQAANKAVSIMQAACPDATPLTPTGRLDATEKRLQAMIDAANTVKPALGSFYGSLSSEQKARFNRIGQELASSKD